MSSRIHPVNTTNAQTSNTLQIPSFGGDAASPSNGQSIKEKNLFEDEDGNISYRPEATLKTIQVSEFHSPKNEGNELRISPFICSTLPLNTNSPQKTKDELSEAAMNEEENRDDLSPLPESRMSPKNRSLVPFRRQDSIPVVMQDFQQIEKHLVEGNRLDDEGGFTPLESPERNAQGLMGMSMTSSFHVSKFAPDNVRQTSNPSALIKPRTIKVSTSTKAPAEDSKDEAASPA